MKNNRKQIRYSLQLLLHLQKNKVTENQDGYAMLITSILAILMFSLLSVYLFSANLYKSVANAVVDSGSTFYAAESGMNKRAKLVRAKFEGYSQPTGLPPGGLDVATQMQNCINNRGAVDNAATVGTGDLRCSEAEFDYKESMWKGQTNSLTERYDNNPAIKYRAYSFTRNLTGTTPLFSRIPAGELFAGLNMQEYRYRIYTTAIRESSGYLPISSQTLLQMDFNSRVVPLFQFAAFYDGDLEILPGPPMLLSGPVHSNGSLYLGGDNSLTIGGSVTAGGSLYNKRKNNDATYPDGRVVINTTATTLVNLLSANGGTPTTDPLPSSGLQNSFGDFVKAGVPRLTVPTAGFLGLTDTQQVGGVGQYFGKADLRIRYQPGQANTIAVTAIKTGSTPDPASCAGLSISSDRNEVDSLACTVLSPAQLQSLQQPVLVRAGNTNEVLALSPSPTSDAASIAANTPTVGSQNAALALQQAIVSQALPVPLSELRGTTTINTLAATAGNVGARWTAIKAHPRFAPFTAEFTRAPQAIANRAGYFYRAAPIQIYNSFYNNREENFLPAANTNGGNLNILQTDIKSLTIWNRDNVVVATTGNATVLPTTTILPTTGIGTPDLLFNRVQAPAAIGSKYATVCNGGATDPRNRSLQCLGLAASDTSEGGMVLHATVDNTGLATDDSVVRTTPARSSSYGFAFTGGSDLPGALTVASDQAVYLQGDYNYYDATNTTNPNNNVVTHPYNMSNNVPSNGGLKEPAAVLADSLNVLSNACIDANNRLSCGINNIKLDATSTRINAAFLAGVNVTTTGDYNGGLENYPRFHENWNGDTLTYRGSFISLGNSLKVLGNWNSQVYTPPGRDWNYDLAFNNVISLPPLTPRVVVLKQKVFKRDYDNSRS